MKISKLKPFVFASVFGAMITACGGGSSDSSEVALQPEVPVVPEAPIIPSEPVTTYSLTGKVIDGYIKDAIVYLDLNTNNKLDEGEPNTITDSSGGYQLDLTDEQKLLLNSIPVRAQLSGDAIDIDTGEAFSENPAILSTLMSLSSTGDSGAISISPFSTELVASIEDILVKYRDGELSVDEFALELNLAKTTFMLSLSDNLGIDPFDVEVLLGDFVTELAESNEFSAEDSEVIRATAISRTDLQQKIYKMKVELESELDDNQRASVEINVYPFTEYHTRENMILEEVYKKIHTELENGDNITELDIVKTRVDNTGMTLVDEAGDAYIYEIYKGTISKSTDGVYTEIGAWEKDLNKDNIRKIRGQVYRVGTYDETGYQVKAYFDETSPSFDSGYGIDEYDGINIPEAIKNGDLSAIEQMQNQINTSEILDGAKINTYQFNSLRDSGGYVFDQQIYLERRITSISSDGLYREEIFGDKDGDGEFDERIVTTLTAKGKKEVFTEDLSSEKEPEVTEPELTEPEVTEPEVTEPELTEPEVTEPEVTEPEVTEPEVTEPEVTEPEVTEPGDEVDQSATKTFTLYFKALTEANELASEFEHSKWGLHIWNDESCAAFTDEVLEKTPFGAVGFDSEKGAYFELSILEEQSDCANFFIHKGIVKSTDSAPTEGDGELVLDVTGDSASLEQGSFTIVYP